MYQVPDRRFDGICAPCPPAMKIQHKASIYRRIGCQVKPMRLSFPPICFNQERSLYEAQQK